MDFAWSDRELTWRFETVDKEIDSLKARAIQLADTQNEDKGSITRLEEKVDRMTEAFDRVRNALYSCAAAIVAAAILVVLLGHG